MGSIVKSVSFQMRRGHLLGWMTWGLIALGGAESAIAQTNALCPVPALERVQIHQVARGETVETVANQYNLLPATVRLMNPTLQGNALSPGQRLRLPPFNGIEVTVPAGSTWQSLARTYQVRADVLFEINGCPATLPQRVFVPGVNGLPVAASVSDGAEETDPLRGYPLTEVSDLLVAFGWQPHPEEDRLVFNSGVIVAATPDEAVLAVGSGTVAYANVHETLGLLVVINHEQGLQTRYANLAEVQVEAGDRVAVGDAIATVLGEPTGELSSLYFEVRSNSDLGWVARNPGDYIPDLAIR